MAHQDAKLAAMRFALTVTDGTINDKEIEYLAQTFPTAGIDKFGTTDAAWMLAWDSVTVPAPIPDGQWNDRAAAWLEGLGHTGNLTDQWNGYWSSLPVAAAMGGPVGAVLLPFIAPISAWVSNVIEWFKELAA